MYKLYTCGIGGLNTGVMKVNADSITLLELEKIIKKVIKDHKEK